MTFVVLLVLASAGDARATTAFIAPSGRGELTVVATSLSGSVVYDDDAVGGRPAGLLRVQTTSGAVSVGLGHQMMGLVQVPLVIASVSSGDDVASIAGLGDGVFGLQVGLFDDGIVALSARGDVKLPLYRGQPSVGGRQPFDGTRTAGPVPALGDGQVDVTLSAAFAARFPFGGHLSWDLGYRVRTDDVSDAVIGTGSFVVPVLDDRLLPTWNLQFVNSFDAAVDDDGVVHEAVGRGFVATGPAVDVALRELHEGLFLRAGAELVFRGRNAPGGVQLLWGMRCAF